MTREHVGGIDHLVVVPDDPGAIVPLASIDRPRGDVDEVLDEMFGDVDDEGPGVTDALLLGGGAVAVVATQLVTLPAAILIAGLASLGLGSVLPIRSGFRRLRTKRQSSRMRDLIGQGHLLDTRHPITSDLVAAHQTALAAAEQLSPVNELRTCNAAHGLVTEVATLLEGHLPSNEAEISYASARLDALRQLSVAASDAQAAPEHDRRRAQADARQAIELTAGDSALHQAKQLTDDLTIESHD